MTERKFAGRLWFAYLGVVKHACCFFDFNLAWGLPEKKATLCAAKAERSIVTTMAQYTIIKVLDLLKHSAKRAVVLKAELERLMLLAIVKDGTSITIIEDGPKEPTLFLKPIDGTTAILENHISNNAIFTGLKI